MDFWIFIFEILDFEIFYFWILGFGIFGFWIFGFWIFIFGIFDLAFFIFYFFHCGCLQICIFDDCRPADVGKIKNSKNSCKMTHCKSRFLCNCRPADVGKLCDCSNMYVFKLGFFVTDSSKWDLSKLDFSKMDFSKMDFSKNDFSKLDFFKSKIVKKIRGQSFVPPGGRFKGVNLHFALSILSLIYGTILAQPRLDV